MDAKVSVKLGANKDVTKDAKKDAKLGANKGVTKDAKNWAQKWRKNGC